jgi:hypothetical protein
MTSLAAVVFAVIAAWSLPAAAQNTASDRQIAVLMLAHYARAYGHQVTWANIQLERARARVIRDEQVLKQKQELVRRKADQPIELEIAELTIAWSRAQLAAAEKILANEQAEYDALVQVAKHYGGNPTTTESLYAIFRRGWDSGCQRLPLEVTAAKALVDLIEKTVVRARETHAQKIESLNSMMQREADLGVAKADYEYRAASLDRCRTLLLPSLEDLLAIKP